MRSWCPPAYSGTLRRCFGHGSASSILIVETMWWLMIYALFLRERAARDDEVLQLVVGEEVRGVADRIAPLVTEPDLMHAVLLIL
jgi:hypothetical protein